MFESLNPFSNQDLAEEIGCYFPTGNKSSFCVLVKYSSPCWGPLFWGAPLSWLTFSFTHIGLKNCNFLTSFCLFDFAEILGQIIWRWSILSSELIDNIEMKMNHEPWKLFWNPIISNNSWGSIVKSSGPEGYDRGIFGWTRVQHLVGNDCWGLIPTYWC